MTARTPTLLIFNLITDADANAQGFTTDWLNALAARCARVDVLTMYAGRLELAQNVRLFSVGREKGYSEARRLVNFYRLLARLLRQNHYDACFAHMQPLFALLGAPLLRLYGVPQTLWFAHKSVNWKLRLAEKVVRQVVTPSPESFRVPSKKVRVVGHGVDTERFVPLPRAAAVNRPFTVLSVSRLAPVKQLETLLAAAQLLRDRHGVRDFHLRIVGNAAPEHAAYAAGMRQRAADMGLAGCVEFAGHVPYAQIAPVYQQADVLVNVSATGSVDKAPLEAMSCGLAVVTTNEAFGALLAQWGDLLLAPPQNADALAGRLARLAQMPAGERAALGADLRTLVQREHSLTRLVNLLVDEVLIR